MSHRPPDLELLTVQDLAQLLQVSLRTIWRLRQRGQLPPPVQFSGSVRWRAQEIRNWINSGCPAQTVEAN